MSLAPPNRAASGVASGAGQWRAVAPFAVLILIAPAFRRSSTNMTSEISHPATRRSGGYTTATGHRQDGRPAPPRPSSEEGR